MSTMNMDVNGATAEEMKELGVTLRSLREAQNLSYEDVTASIHVRPFVLQAIEEGRVLEVVDVVYARGFIKSYCEMLCAEDLWKKHKDSLVGTPGVRVVQSEAVSPLGLNQTTPIFRRSSMIWVYVILVLAVAGAAYLLYSQQSDEQGGLSGFFRRQEPSRLNGLIAASGDAVLSHDTSSIAVSADDAPVIGERSPDASSVDLSWMGGSVLSDTRSPDTALSTELFIEITGSQSRLEVKSQGSVITSRNLVRGDVRSYDITAATDVIFSNAGAARLVWRGKVYAPLGDPNARVELVFTPSSGMTVVKGRVRPMMQ